MAGYIKIYRQMTDWGWYKDPNTFRVFMHLLLTASYEDNEFRGHHIKAGQVVTGRKQLAEALGISEQSVRTALQHLISTNEITVRPTNKFTIITIENWRCYQCSDEQTNQQSNQQPNQQLTNNQPTTNHTQKIKKVRNKKEIDKEKGTYGEFKNVRLTEAELKKLQDRFRDWKERIETLSAYMQSNGKRYKDHYATILNWSRREGNRPRANQYIQEPPRYKEFEKEPEKQREPMPESTKKIMEQLGGMFK